MNPALELLPKKARDAASRQWREDMGCSFNITERLCRAIHAANTAIGLDSTQQSEGEGKSSGVEAALRAAIQEEIAWLKSPDNGVAPVAAAHRADALYAALAEGGEGDA